MLASAVVGSVTSVPDVREGCHRLWFALVEKAEEVGVDRTAVADHAAAVEAQGVSQEVFVARHDVGEVPQCLRRVAVCSNVDVDSTPAGGIALGASLAEASLPSMFVKISDQSDRKNSSISDSVFGSIVSR